MSQNVEIVKRGIDAFNRRDLDSFADGTTPDFEMFTIMARTIEGGSFRGRKGIEAYFRDSRNAWEEARVAAEEFRDLGDRVLVLGRLAGRGRASGVQLDSPVGIVVELRDSKMSRARAYLDHGEALRAAGLSE